MQPKIHDYALLGDGRSAALVSRDGSVDWMCWPRFDSASVFGALLDAERGGCFSIEPAAPAHVSRRYIEHTNVLETRFENADGAAVLVDALTIASEDDKAKLLVPARRSAPGVFAGARHASPHARHPLGDA
jgi:GH15 family glucan-1,4-alpha-glucosidase